MQSSTPPSVFWALHWVLPIPLLCSFYAALSLDYRPAHSQYMISNSFCLGWKWWGWEKQCLNAVHPVIPSRYKCSNKRKQSQQIGRYRYTKYKIWKGKHKEAIGSGFSWPLVSGSREVQIGAKLQAGNTAVQKGNTGKQAGNTGKAKWQHWSALTSNTTRQD